MSCLFACNFTLKFIYALTGWEGAAADALLWHDALQKVSLFLMANICWEMQDFQLPLNYLHHIKVFNIILQSGGMHNQGYLLFI